MATIASASALAVVTASFGCGGTEAASPTDDPLAQQGRDLAVSRGCTSCHSTDGSDNVAPTWQGLAGSSRALRSGQTVAADDAYLTRAILDPATDVVDGYAPIMPEVGLDPEQAAAIVAYIRSLS